VFSGNPDIDEVEMDVLDLLADSISDDIQPGQDEDQNRGFGSKPRDKVDPRKHILRKSLFDLRLIDDQKPPGLDVVSRRGQPGRFNTSQDFLPLNGSD